jgi:heme-degrading monooxygenase HmoA
MIHLHLDLMVDPAKEAEMLRYFANVFRPAAAKFAGYIDVNMLKLRAALTGRAPSGVNYRFCLVYQSEELRQKWVTSDVHAEVWGGMERTFSSTDYDVLLFDVS